MCGRCMGEDPEGMRRCKERFPEMVRMWRDGRRAMEMMGDVENAD